MAINNILFCMSSFELEILVKRSLIHVSSLRHLANRFLLSSNVSKSCPQVNTLGIFDVPHLR